MPRTPIATSRDYLLFLCEGKDGGPFGDNFLAVMNAGRIRREFDPPEGCARRRFPGGSNTNSDTDIDLVAMVDSEGSIVEKAREGLTDRTRD